MVLNYKSVFDIIGPVMIGPSSSHTAGAVAIGHAARKIFHAPATTLTVRYYESFAETHRGHGTDYALVAGVLGLPPADPQVPNALTLAQQQGLAVKFIEMAGPSPIGHPNTAIVTLSNEQRTIEVAGCSIGGGTIEIRRITVDGFELKPSGPLPILLVWGAKDNDQRIQTKLAKMTKIMRQQSYNTAAKHLVEFDLERSLQQHEVDSLQQGAAELVYL
ncbi:serine dehydratase beta chain [Loigolactobacillus zhaoyuanensis]|uniref:serine dehydratase beta chain n=1 Tax=Loigolactobacillus zhaoyuanensis TaxID=2486017 RepID=UPI000F7396A7|nr:serine dehydratase beta chain [Loigolactobacillus zhaoyuanensis]